jgi:hypothetical protein
MLRYAWLLQLRYWLLLECRIFRSFHLLENSKWSTKLSNVKRIYCNIEIGREWNYSLLRSCVFLCTYLSYGWVLNLVKLRSFVSLVHADLTKSRNFEAETVWLLHFFGLLEPIYIWADLVARCLHGFLPYGGFARCLLGTCHGGWLDCNKKEIRVCDLGFMLRWNWDFRWEKIEIYCDI